MAKVTIKDVAKEAGVSIATVSNALNGVDVLNPATKQRVMDAVEKLQYIPNLNGRYLKAGESKMIGFFTNSIAGPYFCTLLDTMSRQCERRGYGMNIFVTKDPNVIMGNILGRRIDGAIIYEDMTVRDEEIEKFKKEDVGVVFLDREIEDKKIASVLFDSYKSAYEATRHLINLGHKRIAFIECVDDVLDSLRRKQGYLAAMKEFDLEDESLIMQGAFSEEYTYNTMTHFMRFHGNRMPEAIVAGNDISAIGCIKALNSEGFKVPDDISVIGFDDIDISEYFTPPLTTVNNPIARQGMVVIDTLIDMIQGKEEGSIKRLEGKLVLRDSCTLRR